MPNPWLSLRRDQLIRVNKAVNEKEQLEKGLEEGEKINFRPILSPCCQLIFHFPAVCTTFVYSASQRVPGTQSALSSVKTLDQF
jgi:hypothetical protein